MSSDNYEYTKSLEKQGMRVETPYASKQWQYVPDSNGSSYQSSGLAPINFDLTSLVGDSDTMLNMSEAFIAIPLVLTSAWTSANDGSGVAVDPAACLSAWCSTSIKPYFNIIHQADVSINGTQVEQPVPFLNVKTSFKLMSSMSQNDLSEYGPILGMSNELDNVKAMKFNGSVGTNAPTGTGGAFPNSNNAASVGATVPSALQGNGVCNNCPFYATIAANAGQSNDGEQGGLAQGNNTYNKALSRRAERIIDLSKNTSRIYGPAGDGTQYITGLNGVNQSMMSYYTTQGFFLVWYDVAIIRLKDLFDSYAKLPHSRRIDSRITLYCNVGTTGVMLMNQGTNFSGQMIFSGNATTITGTCPYVESFMGPSTTTPPSIPAVCRGKVTGIGIVRPTSVIQWGINFSGVQAHQLNQCRIYYPVCKFKPDIMKEYISLNRHKQIMFEKSYYLPVFKTGPNGFVSQQITSGARQVKSILVVPVISQTTHGTISPASSVTGVIPFGQHQSPFDTFPMTNAPIPLINFNVKCGNIDVLSTPLYYNFEQFLEQFSSADAINPGDFGITNGLINDYVFNQGYKFYYLNLERGSDSQQMDMRSITVQYQNASLQEIDCHIFVSYFQSATIDIETSEFKLL